MNLVAILVELLFGNFVRGMRRMPAPAPVRLDLAATEASILHDWNTHHPVEGSPLAPADGWWLPGIGWLTGSTRSSLVDADDYLRSAETGLPDLPAPRRSWSG